MLLPLTFEVCKRYSIRSSIEGVLILSKMDVFPDLVLGKLLNLFGGKNPTKLN